MAIETVLYGPLDGPRNPGADASGARSLSFTGAASVSLPCDDDWLFHDRLTVHGVELCGLDVFGRSMIA